MVYKIPASLKVENQNEISNCTSLQGGGGTIHGAL